jgi:hypothetical protein
MWWLGLNRRDKAHQQIVACVHGKPASKPPLTKLLNGGADGVQFQAYGAAVLATQFHARFHVRIAHHDRGGTIRAEVGTSWMLIARRASRMILVPGARAVTPIWLLKSFDRLRHEN